MALGKRNSEISIKSSKLISIGVQFKSNPKRAIERLAKEINFPIEHTKAIVDVMSDEEKKEEVIATIMTYIDDLLEGKIPHDLIEDLKDITGIEINNIAP